MVKLLKVRLLVVLATVVHVEPPFVENSQRTTEPLFPVTLIAPVFEPLHTVETVAALVVPAVDTASTVMVAVWPLGVELQFVAAIEVKVKVEVEVRAEVVTLNVPDPVPVVVTLPAPKL